MNWDFWGEHGKDWLQGKDATDWDHYRHLSADFACSLNDRGLFGPIGSGRVRNGIEACSSIQKMMTLTEHHWHRATN